MIEASVNVTVPKGFDLSQVEEEVRKGLYESAQSMKNEMETFVENWKNKPRMQMESKRGNDKFSIRIFPVGDGVDLWHYVSFGTKPHSITPKNAKCLRFPYKGPGVSYAPKTGPWGYRGGAGKKLGPIKKFNAVSHPGITPREFEIETILAKEKEFRKTIDDALKIGLDKAGRK